MLDDLKFIHQRDASDALGIAEKQGQQLAQGFEVQQLGSTQAVSNIVFSGMGGSALAALMSNTWPAFTVPFEISRNYSCPDYVNESSLFITSSYSGNTEETISALEQAIERRTQVGVITSGGKLQELAARHNLPFVLLPTGLQPRYASLYSFKALVTLLDAFGVTNGAAQELASKQTFLAKSVESWKPDVPTSANQAKQLAQEIVGKAPVLYAGPLMTPAAYKWKISMNENAKNLAWWNAFPEFNHNEFLGWTSHPVDKPYRPILLTSPLELPRVQRRFEVSKKLLSGRWPDPITLEPQGNDALEQMLWFIALGDFTSLYLALLNNQDPTPVDLIERFKKEL